MGTQVHGVFDERSLRRQQVLAKRERQRAEAAQYAKDIMAQGRLVGATATDMEHQMGRSMSHQLFEAAAKRLAPNNIHCEAHPTKPGMRCMWWKMPDGTRALISPYEAGQMPEFSLLEEIIEEQADPDVLGGKVVVDRKDLPPIKGWDLEYDDETGDVRGEGYLFDQAQTQPGILRYRRPGMEIRRGWRTVLSRLVHPLRYVSPEAIERVFGTGEREAWAQLLGKHAPAHA